jgi:hypothetical protein
MIYRIFFRILFIETNTDKIALGRWGYHWEKYRHFQKYYE